MILLETVQLGIGGAIPVATLIVTKRIPALLGSAPGGYLADLVSAKKLLVWLNLAIGTLSFMLLDVVGHSTPSASFLLLFYALISFIEGAYKPVLTATLSQKYRSAHSVLLQNLNTHLNVISMLVIIVAGLLSSVVNLKNSLVWVAPACAIGFLLSAFFALLIPAPKVLRGLPTNRQEKVASLGIEYPRLFQPLLVVGLLSALYAFISLILVQYPYRVYFNGSQGLGILYLALGVGTLGGSFVYKKTQRYLGLYLPDSTLFLVGSCLLLVAFVQTRNFTIASLVLTAVMTSYVMGKLILENYLVVTQPTQSIGKTFAWVGVMEEVTIALSILIFSHWLDLSLKTNAPLFICIGLIILGTSQYFLSAGVPKRKDRECLKVYTEVA